MGKRGPKPQAKELKELRGNPGKRALPDSPSSDPDVPLCPDDLLDIKSVWDEYGDVLKNMGVLQKSDGIMWDALWRTWAKYKEIANRRVELDEMVDAIEGEEDLDKISRILKLVTRIEPLEIQYLNTLMRLLDHFGMSPSSRSSIQISKPQEEDEFTKFLKEQEKIKKVK